MPCGGGLGGGGEDEMQALAGSACPVGHPVCPETHSLATPEQVVAVSTCTSDQVCIAPYGFFEEEVRKAFEKREPILAT
jgi:hypothetical protein